MSESEADTRPSDEKFIRHVLDDAGSPEPEYYAQKVYEALDLETRDEDIRREISGDAYLVPRQVEDLQETVAKLTLQLSNATGQISILTERINSSEADLSRLRGPRSVSMVCWDCAGLGTVPISPAPYPSPCSHCQTCHGRGNIPMMIPGI